MVRAGRGRYAALKPSWCLPAPHHIRFRAHLSSTIPLSWPRSLRVAAFNCELSLHYPSMVYHTASPPLRTPKRQYQTKYPSEGAYACVGCGQPLYYAKQNFSSGCGWPAIYDGVPGAVEERPDADGARVEIVCSKCNGHLGHVFKGEGFPTPTDARHCVNGICLSYELSANQPADVAEVPARLRLPEIPA